jgi:hypothetical protein
MKNAGGDTNLKILPLNSKRCLTNINIIFINNFQNNLNLNITVYLRRLVKLPLNRVILTQIKNYLIKFCVCYRDLYQNRPSIVGIVILDKLIEIASLVVVHIL